MVQTFPKQNRTYEGYRNTHDPESNKIFGFWIYLMSDCIIFATLFVTYAVMVNSTSGGLESKEIYKLPFVLGESTFLLLSSFSYGMAIIGMSNGSKNVVNRWLITTFLLGFSFILMELYEFNHLIEKGFSPDRSGFLSGYFTLVGTHSLHVASGLLWMLVLIYQIAKNGLTKTNRTRIMCLSLFWHFLDIIWICVFTVVYLIGSIQ